MLKRRRHFNGIFALKVVAVVVALLVQTFICGCGYYVAYKIENYDGFINSYTKYTDDDEKHEPEVSKFKSIIGFTPIIEQYFIYGKEFSAETAFVKTESGNALLTFIGDLVVIDDDFTQIEIIDGKYVFESDGKFGVKNILGREIVPPLYDRIQIVGNTVLAVVGQTAVTYAGGTVAGVTNDAAYVELIDENYIYLNGYVCGLDFTVCLVGGYPILSIPVNGIVTVNVGGGYVGYYDTVKDKLIGDRYKSAAAFCNGVAVAVNDKGENVVINANGEVLYVTNDKILGDKSGDYMCYVTHNMYGVLDCDFNDITGAIFEVVKYEKAVGDYLIVRAGSGEKLYSLKELKYTDDVYDNIEYSDGIYFCKIGEAMFLFDDNLNLITECNDASISYGILKIKDGDKYSYFKRAV